MTDLNLAYGFEEESDSQRQRQPMNQDNDRDQEYSGEKKQKKVQYQEEKQQVISPPVKEKFEMPIQYTDYQTSPTQKKYYTSHGTSYSFWDRMSIKRSEVIKLAVFALVIVLGISLDRMGTFYISKYLSDNILTDVQELMVRLAYPVLIFLILWIIKAL